MRKMDNYITNCIHHQVCRGAYNCQTKCEYFEERSQGEWIFKYDEGWFCSNCNTQSPLHNCFNYCPNCGAKMRTDMRGGEE